MLPFRRTFVHPTTNRNNTSQLHIGRSSILLTHLQPKACLVLAISWTRGSPLCENQGQALLCAPPIEKQRRCSPRRTPSPHTPPTEPDDSRCSTRNLTKMATNGAPDSFSPGTILAAMTTMRGGEPNKKKAAMDYLSKFQKSVRGFWRHRPHVIYTEPSGN